MTEQREQTDAPRGIPFYIEQSLRRVQDPACLKDIDGWAGANQVTFCLLQALESLRDPRVVLTDLASQGQPNSDRRRIKRISTPLVSFARSIRDICKELLANPDFYGGLSDAVRAEIRQCDDEMARVVPLSGNGALRVVRNKIDAHVDPDTVMNPQQVWGHVELGNYIPWLGCSLITFSRLLVLDVYGWTCKSAHPDIFRLMEVDGTLVDFVMVDGQPSIIAGITQTKFPKVSIAGELNAVITLHNTLLQSLPPSPGPTR